MIKNQNKNNGKLCDTKKKLEQGSIINETKIIKVKVNVLLINNIKKNIKLLGNYIHYVYKKVTTIIIAIIIVIMIIHITIIINLNY